MNACSFVKVLKGKFWFGLSSKVLGGAHEKPSARVEYCNENAMIHCCKI
jgi:hypothetical protein